MDPKGKGIVPIHLHSLRTFAIQLKTCIWLTPLEWQIRWSLAILDQIDIMLA